MARPGRPQHSIDRQSRAQLGDQDEKELLRKLVRKELANHGQFGVTAPKMAQQLGISPTTARVHLDHIVAIGEGYKHEVSPKLFQYFPNGKLSHPAREEPFQLGERFYAFKFVSNAFGEMVLVQEKEKDAWGTFRTTGGIVIPKRLLRSFAKKLQSICDENNLPDQELSEP